MKIIKSVVLLSIASSWQASAFSPGALKSYVSSGNNLLSTTCSPSTFQSKDVSTSILSSPIISTTALQQSTNSDAAGFFDDLELNVPYAALWAGLLAFALNAPGGLSNPESTELLNKIIANPLDPGCSVIFTWIFSLFTFIPVSLAALIMPSAQEQKLPATPALFGCSMLGYFVLGPYMATRKAVTDVDPSTLGWFTSNVLENKIVHAGLFLVGLSSLFTTGFLPGLVSDFDGQTQEFINLFQSTSFVTISTADLTVMTIAAASLIPEDLKRRGMQDEGKANLIAGATLLLPVIGSTLYCALRPKLPEA